MASLKNREGLEEQRMWQEAEKILEVEAREAEFRVRREVEEAKTENRMLEEAVTTLKEQVNIYEQEVDQIKEQSRIKEANFEEEISILKTQLSQAQKQTVTENIELIRVQRENKIRSAENQSLKAQVRKLFDKFEQNILWSLGSRIGRELS